MSSLTKWVPRLITGTAIVHLAYGVVVPSMAESLKGIASDGFVASVGGHPDRESWLWFMLTGVSWLGLGEFTRWSVRETGQLPVSLGVGLLAVAVPMTVVEPASGGWLVAAVGVLALRAARAGGPRRDQVEEPLRPALRA